MSEEIKNSELKETELTEEDLDKVSGGAGIGGGDRAANGSGPEDHWFGTAGINTDAGTKLKGANAQRNH